MLHAPHNPHVFGPYDGDFDPFEDEEDAVVLITFGRHADAAPRSA
jgi:hypothetical protein